jgi:hypothetical protein
VSQLTTSVGFGSFSPVSLTFLKQPIVLQIQAVSLNPVESAYHADIVADVESPLFSQDVSMDNGDADASAMNLVNGKY